MREKTQQKSPGCDNIYIYIYIYIYILSHPWTVLYIYIYIYIYTHPHTYIVVHSKRDISPSEGTTDGHFGPPSVAFLDHSNWGGGGGRQGPLVLSGGTILKFIVQVHLNKLECRGKVHLFQ